MRLSIPIASLSLSLLFCATCFALDSHGHDHDDDHEKQSSSVTANSNHLANELKRIGGKIEMIESRVIRGQDVIALPRTAILSENGKHYVIAGENDDLEKFEKWEVSLGSAIDQNYVEAKTGLFPGDHVIVKKQLNLPKASTDSHHADSHHADSHHADSHQRVDPPRYTYQQNPQIEHSDRTPTYPQYGQVQTRNGFQYHSKAPQTAKPNDAFTHPQQIQPYFEAPNTRFVPILPARVSAKHCDQRHAESEFYQCPHGNIYRIERVVIPNCPIHGGCVHQSATTTIQPAQIYPHAHMNIQHNHMIEQHNYTNEHHRSSSRSQCQNHRHHH